MMKLNNDILIRNLDASYFYWKIKNDEKIAEYENAKRQLKEEENEELKANVKKLSQEIFSFKKEIILDKKDNRFLYSGTLSDSLMSRKLRSLVVDKDGAIRTVGKGNTSSGTDYSDLIINVKFKSDVMISTNENKKVYNQEKGEIEELSEKRSKRLISKQKLRQMAYRDGITINGIHYVDFQRTSSKARTGNCLFIDDRYFDVMEEWQTLGIPFRMIVRSEDKKNPFEKIDIVSTRSYASLTSSSIIGTLDIDPYDILLIDEVEGFHTMPCNVVDINQDTKKLQVAKEEYTQRTELWDGQSLADSSVFKNGKYYIRGRDGKEISHTYEDKGFMLLRNHFFKSAIFNTNLKEYYSEKFQGIENPVITDRFGNLFNPFDVKLVTTKNSCKIFKFSDLICAYLIPEEKKNTLKKLENDLETFNKDCSENENQVDMKDLKKQIKFEQDRLTWDWYREKLKLEHEVFGVCKYEKYSKFGDRQQVWYQVLGSLNLNENQLWKITEPQVHEVNLMKKYPAFLKNRLNTKAAESDNIGARMMKSVLEVNEDIARTVWYANYRRSYLNSILDRLREGKIQLNNSDFCVLVANPYEMLRASAGEKIETSILSDFECWNSRYQDGEDLYGFRSPHICTGNCALLKNTNRPEWKWFNFTNRILVINLWGKGAFLSQIWNGCDTDSDTAFIGNDPTVLDEVRNVISQNYLVPINGLSPEADPHEFNEVEMAKVDSKLSNDLIGKICNLARDIQSFYWHLFNTGTEENKSKYLPMIYDDICILEVASNIAIDSAKRRYKGVNLAGELKAIKQRPYFQAEGAILEGDGTILFTEKRYKKILSAEVVKKYNELLAQRNQATTEEDVQRITVAIDKLLTVNDVNMVRPQFTKKLKAKPKKKTKKVENIADLEVFRQKQILAAQERKALEEKIYKPLACPMDKLSTVVQDHLERADRTKYITFTEILNPIPKGVKADYNRIEAIKKIAIEWNTRLNQLYSKFKTGAMTFEEMYEQRQNMLQCLYDDIRYTDVNHTIERKITTWDIQKLIRDVYDTHPKRDKHGKIVRDEQGKVVIDDKRDKRLVGEKKDKNCVGQKLLQWIYEVYPEEFIATLKENKGKVTHIQEVKNYYLEPGEVFELYGKNYKIV